MACVSVFQSRIVPSFSPVRSLVPCGFHAYGEAGGYDDGGDVAIGK